MKDEKGDRVLPSPEVRVKQISVALRRMCWTLLAVYAVLAWWRI
ncbi:MULTISPECIES: hypothetical protein [Streptomyces]|uniref:Uncharacterized protein n=2 Tax=Streptomyces TaxID=1883 RepID=A0ABV9IWS9_9ACTN